MNKFAIELQRAPNAFEIDFAFFVIAGSQGSIETNRIAVLARIGVPQILRHELRPRIGWWQRDVKKIIELFIAMVHFPTKLLLMNIWYKNLYSILLTFC